MGTAHLLSQLSLPQNPTQGLPLLHHTATLASLTCPQPAYVYALLSEFTELPVAPYILLPASRSTKSHSEAPSSISLQLSIS